MSNKHEAYSELLTLLCQMLTFYQQWLDLSHRARDSLTPASLPALLGITAEQEKIILELSVMEEKRQFLVRRLAEHIGKSPSEVSLQKLSTLSPKSFQERFHTCRDNLLTLIQAINQVNAQNAVLLNAALASAQTSLGLISRLVTPTPIYGNGGHLHATDIGGKVLQKQV